MGELQIGEPIESYQIFQPCTGVMILACIIKDLTLFIVPCVKTFTMLDIKHLDVVLSSMNKGWNNRLFVRLWLNLVCSQARPSISSDLM